MSVTIPSARSSTARDALVERLSRQSVDKHFDAYADIDWDAPELAIDPTDPRWELVDFDPVANTSWYHDQPSDVRARLGLHRIAMTMRTGWEFENVLQRGLLSHAYWLGNGMPEFRYVHHEVVEESQHTMMFQEFVNRTGLPVRGLPPRIKLAAELFVVPLARLDPPLFFFFVLGGEDPIDHVQRRRLRAGIAHPLLERIIRIHVTEEARHLSFARHYLREELGRLPRARRALLSIAVPALLGVMTRLMLAPPPGFAHRNSIPKAVVREAKRSNEHRALRSDSVAKIRRLCTESGLMNPFARLVWRAAGLARPSGAGGAAGGGA
ncbi:MAG: AurF N-oxygenase family protein [Acidimicrobiales bacterium]